MLVTALLAGCAAYGPVSILYPPEAELFGIPEGQLPSPGECRLWFPDLPPGQQPPPGNCYELQRNIPPGAVLIRG